MKFFSIAKQGSRRFQSAFTMMEIAISLAVIGIALVAIIGILPVGLRTQRDNREKTLINQDASVFMELIRNGVNISNAPATDLTNYVFAITNYWYFTNAATKKSVLTNDGYDFYGANVNRAVTPASPTPDFPLTNNYCILGLMSIPEYTDANGKPIPVLMPDLPGGCYSNHIVAYVHSMSGLALEKPPQGNSLLIQSSFSYRILCESLPSAVDFSPEWNSSANYNQRDKVFYELQETNGAIYVTYWRSITNGNVGQIPTNNPTFWSHDGYAQTMANDTHELRLTFFWPLLPNNNLPPMPAHQTYRALVTGQLVQTNITAEPRIFLYSFQPQTFTNTP